MKLYFLVGILLIYFPVLYYYKSRIIKVTGNTERPEHLRWYESASFVIKHSQDSLQRNRLMKLQGEVRLVCVVGIIFFWLVALFL